jgi:hypothetical protein
MLEDLHPPRGDMSGRTRKPLVLIRNAPPPDLPPDPPSAEYPVTLLLPDTVLVSPGPHGFNTAVLPGNVVRIRGREARHCFALAREFFVVVAWDRAFYLPRDHYARRRRARLWPTPDRGARGAGDLGRYRRATGVRPGQK